jgi:tRNA-dihydrouridine synthase 3
VKADPSCSWGTDNRGLETTRQFLLQWISFLHRYVPVGLLERPDVLLPRMNLRPAPFYARSDLEALLASPRVEDWIRISEMFLGPVPPGFTFEPKHKSPAYSVAATGGGKADLQVEGGVEG